MTGKPQKDGYQVVNFPSVREVVVDVMVPAERKHMIHVLFEADVTASFAPAFVHPRSVRRRLPGRHELQSQRRWKGNGK